MTGMHFLYEPDTFECELASTFGGDIPKSLSHGVNYMLAKLVPIVTGRHWMNVTVCAMPARFYTFEIFDENAAPVATIETGSGDLLEYFNLAVAYAEQVVGGLVEPKTNLIYLQRFEKVVSDGNWEIATY